MGGIYPGGGYPAQYSQGGSVPADFPATADLVVLIPADDLVVRIPADQLGVLVPVDPEVQT